MTISNSVGAAESAVAELAVTVEAAGQLIRAAAGGPVTLANGSSILILPGALTSDQQVTLSLESLSPDDKDLYTDAAAIFGAGPAATEVLVVDTGSATVQKEILVKLKVSDDFLRSLNRAFVPQLFVQAFSQNEGGMANVFEPLDSDFDPETKELTATIPIWGFTSIRNGRGTNECVLVIGSLPVTSDSIDRIDPLALQSPECTLVPPLEGVTAQGLMQQKSSCYGLRTDPINRTDLQNHRGIDFVKGQSTGKVVAVADGSIIAIGWSRTMGQTVIIQHAGGQQSLYAHLKVGSIPLAIDYPGKGVSQEVRFPNQSKWKHYSLGEIPVDLGEEIGEMGSTGERVTREHLHFEFGQVDPNDPRGIRQRTDPWPCLSSSVPGLQVRTELLGFAARQGENPPSQQLIIGNTGSTTLSYSVRHKNPRSTWLRIEPDRGDLAPGTSTSITIGVNLTQSNLLPGTYTDIIEISEPSSSDCPQTAAVKLIIDGQPGNFTVSASSLSFVAQQGQDPPAKEFMLTNTDASPLNYSISGATSWLIVEPASGVLNPPRPPSEFGMKPIKVGVSVRGLAPGAYRGVVKVSDWVFTSTPPQWVEVTLTICAYSLSRTSQNFPASGGSDSVNVTAPGGCSWTAASNASWIRITPSSGSGNGTISFSVDPNRSSSQRTGTMTIAGQTFTVTQAQGCTYSISPTSRSFGANGGSGSVNVTAPSGCDWTVTSNASWIRVVEYNGRGDGTVSYDVIPNTSTSQRTGTMTIAGQTFTVTQAAAPPPSATLTWMIRGSRTESCDGVPPTSAVFQFDVELPRSGGRKSVSETIGDCQVTYTAEASGSSFSFSLSTSCSFAGGCTLRGEARGQGFISESLTMFSASGPINGSSSCTGGGVTVNCRLTGSFTATAAK